MIKNKNKLVSILKTGVFFLGICVLLWNCEKENNEYPPLESSNQTSIISFKDLPKNILGTIDEVNPSSDFYKKSNNDFVLNREQIIKVVDSLDNTSYSIKFTLANTPKNVLYNLIVTTNEDNVPQDPFIIKYTIDNLDEITQENKTVNYEEMKAKIDFYNYEAFLSSNNLGQKSANRNNGDPCPSYNYPNPGGNSSGGNNNGGNNNGGSDSGGGTVWIWSSGGSVFGITWSFTDGSSGSYALRNGNDCDNRAGGGSTNGGSSGINDGNNGPIDPRDEECLDGYFSADGECISNEEDQIFNELTDPCAKGIFTNLENGIFEDHPLKPELDVPASNTEKLNFNETILNMFHKSTSSHYTIKNGNLSNGANASTDPISNTITLGNSYLARATQLSIARSIIHETVHAYLNNVFKYRPDFRDKDLNIKLREYSRQNGYNDLNRFHHEFMSEYVDAMAYSLYEWDKEYGTGGNLGWEYYTSMAWGGLFQTDPNTGLIVTETDSFIALVSNPTDRQTIADIVVNEQKNNRYAQGTECN